MATFVRLLGWLRPYRRGVFLSGLLAAAAMVMTVAIPWLTGRAIDQIRDGDEPGLTTLALVILAAGVLRLALTVARRLVAGRVSLGVELDLRNGSTSTCRARARLLRPPADRPADVARHRRPAVRALLPRLRPRLHHAVGADDRARRGGDVRRATRPGGASRSLPVPIVVVDRRALRPALAPGAAGGPAADRRADRRRRGEHLAACAS